jgi:hypothetical protein
MLKVRKNTVLNEGNAYLKENKPEHHNCRPPGPTLEAPKAERYCAEKSADQEKKANNEPSWIGGWDIMFGEQQSFDSNSQGEDGI